LARVKRNAAANLVRRRLVIVPAFVEE